MYQVDSPTTRPTPAGHGATPLLFLPPVVSDSSSSTPLRFLSHVASDSSSPTHLPQLFIFSLRTGLSLRPFFSPLQLLFAGFLGTGQIVVVFFPRQGCGHPPSSGLYFNGSMLRVRSSTFYLASISMDIGQPRKVIVESLLPYLFASSLTDVIPFGSVSEWAKTGSASSGVVNYVS